MTRTFAGATFVFRIDRSPVDEPTTLAEDLSFLMQRGVKPIVVAPTPAVARSYVRLLNRKTNVAVGLCGADAALLPATGAMSVGRVQTGILATLTAAGYIPVIEPTAYGFGETEIAIAADDVAAAVAAATDAVRAIFFHAAGGVIDPATRALLDELTPAEALALAESGDLDPDVCVAVRAAANGVRGGVPAAQIIDGRIAHAAIVEILTERHLGTQVTGAVYLGAA
ncbi:MAG: acetylglutamate kinase [Vulcanimicrobiaceae bacterium]